MIHGAQNVREDGEAYFSLALSWNKKKKMEEASIHIF